MAEVERQDEYEVEIAFVLAPSGEDGSIVVDVLSEDPSRMAEVEEVYVKPRRGEGWLARVEQVSGPSRKGTVTVKLEGVYTRQAAERLRGAVLCIRAEESPPLPEGEYYLHQIIGLKVVTTDGRVLGEVEEVIRTGANDVYVAGEYMIPAISQVVREIDLAGKRIVVEPMPGMIEDEEDEEQHENEAADGEHQQADG